MKKNHPIHSHLVVYSDGRIFSKKSKKFLTQQVNSNGYYLVSVSKSYERVHRLVMETFREGDPKYGLDVNHIDGDKANNDLSNLEWCTRQENLLHAREVGLNNCYLDGHHAATFTNLDIHSICKAMQEGQRNCDIAKQHGCSKDLISEIRTGRSWTDISKQYSFEVKRNERISKETVQYVASLMLEGCSYREIEYLSGVRSKTLYRIYNKETFKSVTEGYKFPSLDKTNLFAKDVIKVCELLSSSSEISNIEIERQTGVSLYWIRKIKSRKAWSKLSSDYSF